MKHRIHPLVNLYILLEAPRSGTLRECWTRPDSGIYYSLTFVTPSKNRFHGILHFEGYDKACGITGMSPNGGQRQCLAIARALVGNSPVLLLDEMTCALETESEHLVQDASSKVMKGRLAITIAHSFSTIKCEPHLLFIAGRLPRVG